MLNSEYVRIPATEMKNEFSRILLSKGFTEVKAGKLASAFTNNSLEGVYSHGVNRFPKFIKYTLDGLILPDAEPSLIHASGNIEQWNGNLGPGILNAEFASDRAMILAGNGLGMATLANTNHWMRAGAYGWKAARKGYILICWTNTCPNMPAWGGRDPHIGNNPLVIAVPYGNEAVVLDFAMSQYSYGKLESYKAAGKMLPYPGGYNKNGEMTYDPAEILMSWRILPIGFWKGSSLSLMLDILAAVLSGGRSVHEVSSCAAESGLSQVFIAVNPSKLKNFSSIDDIISRILDDLHNSLPASDTEKVRYPGENTKAIAEENQRLGIPVKGDIWNEIRGL
jgi:3-dehydro-L-gulonate 2-dehydrogenase